MIDRFSALLRGERGAAMALATVPPVSIVDAAERHGVLALVAEAFASSGEPTPPELERALHEAVTRQAAVDLIRERELRRLVAALDADGLQALLIKGAHLAYTVYRRPDQRPRLDTDLLIRSTDRLAVTTLLDRLGYDAEAQAGGDLVNYQATYLLRCGDRVRHVVDVHWRLSNPQAFGRVLDVGELAGDSVPVERLGPVRAPGLVHALLLACVHQVAHHPDADRLIWLYDVDLLARRFTDDDWERLLVQADARGVGAVCGQVIEDAVARLATPVPAAIRADARLRSEQARDAPTAAFLEPGRPHTRIVAQDFKLLPTWSARTRFVLQHLFPPPAYMRTVYAPTSPWPLPLLYAQRAWRGAWRWLVNS